MNKSELRHRIEQFASLQAAHRALARSVHPSELAPVREQSRNLLIQLQGLSSHAKDGDASDPAAAGEGLSLEQVDRELGEQSERTLAILARTDLTQLRATVPLLAAQHPDEVGGLVDLLLTGDLEDDKNLRTLEYLITMLSAEEQGGRRVVIRTPSEVRPRLRVVSQLRLAAAGEECLVAERVLDDAAMQVLQQGEIGEIRDRVRRYKEDLGSDILHPKVLAAAVAYNVAMFNCVAAEIDSSRAIDQLAEELFDPEAASADASASLGAGAEMLGSQAFEELVGALRARVVGEAVEPGPANRVVEALSLDVLRVEDAEVFSADESDEATPLMCSAITLGLVLRHLAQTQGPLRELGLEPEQLATQCVGDLMARMTELARKRFADSNYGDAFRLSDVKTHSLAAHAVMRVALADESAGKGASGPEHASEEASHQPGAMASLVRLVSPQVLVAGVLALLILGLLFGPPMVEKDGGAAGGAELALISPFLESGERGRGDGASRFGGRLSAAWDYLGTSERREVANEIGGHFAGLGVSRVSLLDSHGRVVAIYSGGELVSLSPRPGDSESDEL